MRGRSARSDPFHGGRGEARAVNRPWPVPVQVGADGTPRAVGRLAVSRCGRNGWSRTAGGRGKPLRRRYFELVLEDGSDVVVFCEPGEGRWYRQRD